MSFQLLAASQPPPGPVDLDRVEAEAAQFVAGGWVATYVPPMAAELRAACEVVLVAKDWSNEPEMREALRAYGNAVGDEWWGGEQP